MSIKKGDFLKLHYTGKVQGGEVFDTTEEAVAKQHELGGHAHYGPAIICIGHGQLVRGLDEFLTGKEKGKYHVVIEPANAFGKKEPKLIQLIQTNKFTSQGVRPEVGMTVNIDGMYGLIKTVSGGRTTVDFNHPLAGKVIEYDVEVDGIVTDKAEQVKGLCLMHHLHDAEAKVEGNKATIKLPFKLPENAQKEFSLIVKELTGLETGFEG